MLWCYVCGHAVDNFTSFRAHVNGHASRYELSRPIKYRQHGCKSTFLETFNFFRHIRSFHANDHESCLRSVEPLGLIDSSVKVGSSSSASGDSPCNATPVATDGQVSKCGLDTVLFEGSALVASMRANSSIPYSVIPHVIESFNEISKCLVSACEAEAVRCFASSVDDGSQLLNFESRLKSSLSTFKEPLSFLDTKYKQDSFFSHHEAFVSPQTINFGLRFETRHGKTKMVYDTYEYVSIQQTLEVLLTNEQYVRELLQVHKDRLQSDIIGHFSDGELAEHRFPRSGEGRLSIIIQLFYDGMGTTNPLRGQSVMCNVGVFYYVIKNLPDAWNTCFANVHLLALCYEHDLKVHGFSPILDKFVAEISMLSTRGFQGTFPLIGESTVNVNLCQVTCDNLALNSMLGFVESFSGDFFCTLCYATRDSMQTGFAEECFQMRSRGEYDKDVTSLKHVNETACHVRGVKRYCELNNICGYHVTENFSNDVMHTLLEGVVPLEIGCVLFCLVVEKKLFTLGELNMKVTEFWGLINVDKKKKPPHLNRILPPGSGLSPSMKATQSWGLLKYLPLIIGDRVPAEDEHYKLLLHLSELVDLAFAPRVTCGLVMYMKMVIKDHLTMFVDLFGDRVSLKPKHHFLVHLPTIVMKSGPLVGMSCLKYELKNSFFKRSAHVTCNFINICKTLAYRHQHFALYSLLSNSYQRDCTVVSQTCVTSVHSVLQGSVTDLLCKVLQVGPTDDVVLAYRLKRATYDYQTGHQLITDVIDDEHVFGQVECFVCRTDDDKWHILLRVFETVGYVSHFHSYALRETSPLTYQLLTFSDLCDHHAVCCFKKTCQNRKVMFARMPYYVL